MKRAVSKLLSLLIVMSLVMSFTPMAFAADTDVVSKKVFNISTGRNSLGAERGTTTALTDGTTATGDRLDPYGSKYSFSTKLDKPVDITGYKLNYTTNVTNYINFLDSAGVSIANYVINSASDALVPVTIKGVQYVVIYTNASSDYSGITINELNVYSPPTQPNLLKGLNVLSSKLTVVDYSGAEYMDPNKILPYGYNSVK